MDTSTKTEEIDFAIDESLILVQDRAKTREEIIKKLGGLLQTKGFVKDSYIQAVLERERTYPTGLQAKVAGVAVPHTDTDHVNHPAIAIATLANPITFHVMGSPEDQVPVEIVIMLAVHDAKLVIPILRKVIFILENDQALLKMKNANSKTAIKQAMLDHIQELKEKEKKK